MRSPAVPNRVRVSGLADEFVVVPVDPLAPAADLYPSVDRITIEKIVSFNLVSPTRESKATATCSYNHHCERMEVAQNLLHSSLIHLSRSHSAIADLRHSIEATFRVIRESRQLIADSDGIIARAQPGDPSLAV